MAKKTKEPAPKTPVHQWMHTGEEVLFLRFSDKNGKAHGGFQHPLEIGETVTAADWNPKPVCGGGIHGWPWGIGLGSGKDPDWSALWQVYGVTELAEIVSDIEGDSKCKFHTGILRFSGDWHGAMMFILEGQQAWVEHFADGDSKATGDRSASSATGDRSASSATGYRSASSATGDSSASSATGYRSASSATGKASASVVTGYLGKAQAGEYGCIALTWWNKAKSRYEMRCAEIGIGDGSDGKLKKETWYYLNDQGQFIEA